MMKENSENQPNTPACVSCSRRAFLSSAVMVAVGAALLADCGDGQIGGAGGNFTGVSNFVVKLSDYNALNNVGGIARLSGSSTPVAVVRSSTSTYLAFSLVCPHQGTTVNINGSGFLCPNHGAQFNSSGGWVGGQRTSNLSSISVVLDATAGTLTLG
ncbi:MAG: Rieske (2Fe-2S) protein [Gemmatimonadaceae bacterium]